MDQVAAMQSKAEQLGIGDRLTYIYPHGQCNVKATNCSHTQVSHCGCPNATEAAAAARLQLGSRLVLDAHPGGDKQEGGLGHVVPVFESDFENPIFNLDKGSRWGAAAFETNTGDFSFNDALFEAAELLRIFAISQPNVSSRVAGRAKSFCFQHASYNEGGANQQGMIFSLPNGTWLQPAAYVHKMIIDTWLPHGIPVISNVSDLVVSVQRDVTGAQLVLRFVNHANVGVQGTIIIENDGNPTDDGHLWEVRNTSCLSPPIPGQTQAVNTAGEPELISPYVRNNAVVMGDNGNMLVSVPSNSFMIVQLRRCLSPVHANAVRLKLDDATAILFGFSTPSVPSYSYNYVIEGGVRRRLGGEEAKVFQKLNMIIQRQYNGDWSKAFHFYDADHSGSLSKAELKATLHDSGVGNIMTRSLYASTMVAKLDSSRDGSVSRGPHA